MNLNQYVEVTKRRLSNFDQAHGEVIEIVSLLVNESFHSANLSVNVSLIPASGPPSCCSRPPIASEPRSTHDRPTCWMSSLRGLLASSSLPEMKRTVRDFEAEKSEIHDMGTE